MRISVLAITSLTAPALLAAAPLPPGTYSNEEEVYFDTEAKRAAAPWVAVTIDGAGGMQFIDAFGKPAKRPAFRALTVSEMAERLTMQFDDGRKSELRRARAVTCWGAAPKAKKKPDGSEDWFGAAKLKLFDQGGRVTFGGGETGAPATILRMRNVIWPSGPNRPSLVLYVHTPADPDRAVSYSWADKDAKTIGINLRWMQASCSIDTIS